MANLGAYEIPSKAMMLIGSNQKYRAWQAWALVTEEGAQI